MEPLASIALMSIFKKENLLLLEIEEVECK
jgi:hypothetical protein